MSTQNKNGWGKRKEQTEGATQEAKEDKTVKGWGQGLSSLGHPRSRGLEMGQFLGTMAPLWGWQNFLPFPTRDLTLAQHQVPLTSQAGWGQGKGQRSDDDNGPAIRLRS